MRLILLPAFFLLKWPNVIVFLLLTVGAINSRPAVRWNDQAERDDFISRYERITAATDDFTVFKSNLPGKHVRWMIFSDREDKQYMYTVFLNKFSNLLQFTAIPI